MKLFSITIRGYRFCVQLHRRAAWHYSSEAGMTVIQTGRLIAEIEHPEGN